jgi:hypothetical protein
MLGMVAEYHRKVTGERVRAAHAQAIERGAAPVRLTPGYRRDTKRRVEVDPNTAPVVAEAFRMRADGAAITEVRAYLLANGIDRTFHGVQTLLGSRLVIGVFRFGKKVIPNYCEAIVDVDTWERVQRMSAKRGRRAKSDRLLARLEVLYCASCGSRMVVGTANNSNYYIYRCPPTSDCERRVTIAAGFVEGAVVAEVKRLLEGVEGSASMKDSVRAAEQAVERAERALDAAIEAFGLDDLESAQKKIAELREQRDQARDRLRGLRAAGAPARRVTVGGWDDLTLDEQRGLVRAVIDRVEVGPGRGPDRITVRPHLLVE